MIEKLLTDILAAASLKAIISILLSFAMQAIMPISHFLLATLILVVADLITGIQASIRQKKKIESAGLRRTIIKAVYYFMAILLAQLMQEVYFSKIPLVYITSAFIAITEFKSNLENISIITGTPLGKAIMNWLFNKIKH